MRHRPHTLAIFALIALSACASHPRTAPGPQPAPISIIPIPVSLTSSGGPAFAITPATVIVADTASADQRRAASALVAVLRPSTGYTLPIVTNTDSSTSAARAPGDTNRRTVIRFRAAVDNTLGAEGYTLAADEDSVVIVAPSGAGL